MIKRCVGKWVKTENMDTELQMELAILVITLLLARILYSIHKITTGYSRQATKKRTKPCKTLICVGSGGHTTEILELLNELDFEKYWPRVYVVANSDTTSLEKIEKIECSKKDASTTITTYNIIKIPRSRIVGQSYFTSVFTTLYAILYSVPIVVKTNPDLILCNGPGTCIPICSISFLLKTAFICDTRIVFIESFCRTQSFSLSGRILKYFADNFLVQWPSLKKKLKRAEYVGKLM